MKRLILALSALVLAAGCNKQDSYTYSGIEAGTLGGGVFTSDNGTKMTVVGNEGKYDVTSTRRVLISYQTQPFTDPAHISIDLLGLLDAGILQPEHARSLPADPTGFPLQVSDAWFSSEYLNILATFEGKDPEKHTFSAAYTADEKGLTLRIGHDGSQDETTGNSPMSVFLCVPMYEPALSYDQYAQSTALKPTYPIPVLLQWTSRTLDGGPLTLLERKGSYLPPSATDFFAPTLAGNDFFRTFAVHYMVDVVQLVEHRIVVPSVVGSSPIIHPEALPEFSGGVFFRYICRKD